MFSRFGCSYGCQESPSPQLPQGFEALLLVQASTHFHRFSQLFLSLSETKLCLRQPESKEEQQGSIYFLELLSNISKVLLPERTPSELYKRFLGVKGFFPPSSIFFKTLLVFQSTTQRSPSVWVFMWLWEDKHFHVSHEVNSLILLSSISQKNTRHCTTLVIKLDSVGITEKYLT